MFARNKVLEVGKKKQNKIKSTCNLFNQYPYSELNQL